MPHVLTSIKLLHRLGTDWGPQCWRKSTKESPSGHLPLVGVGFGGNGGCLRPCRTCQISLCPHFTSQCLWIQTNMEPGSSVNAVRSSRVLLGQELRPAVLIIKDGKIKQIQPHSADLACEEVTREANDEHRNSGSDQMFRNHCCCNVC